MNGVIAAAVLGLVAVGTGGQPGSSRQPGDCRVVHGRYAIFADGDRLWVAGSKHFLSVSVDALDKELQSRGWETTVVYGDFTICAKRIADPRLLTIQDDVEVTNYANLRYAPR
jgi:hypothetical protein